MTGSFRPLLKLSSAHPAASVTPYLSFLYQTRTIVQPSRRYPSRSIYRQTRQFGVAKQPDEQGKPRRSKPRAKSATEGASIEAAKEDDKTPLRSEKRARKDVGPEDKDNHTTGRSNTFLEILQEHKSKPKIRTPHIRERAITMTQKEQEIFEHLQNISSKKKPTQPDLISIDKSSNDANHEELVAIFDNIHHKQEPLRSRSVTKAEQQSVLGSTKTKKGKRSNTGTKRGLLDDQPVTISDSSSSEHLQPTSNNTPEDLGEILASAGSDHQLWKLLDEYIFKDMQDLAAVLKEEESLRSHSNLPASNLTSNQEKTKTASFGKVTDGYGPALLHAARLFRTRFPRSPYAALLLPTVKKLGPISYVLAGSTAFYNELLYVRWVYYRDLNGCADLVEDMVSHNILADERTSVVLQMANKARAEEMESDGLKRNAFADAKKVNGLTGSQDMSGKTSSVASGTPVKSFMAGWWQLQGIEAGWARWINAHERLAAMTHKEMQRQHDEQILANQANQLPVDEVVEEIPTINHSPLGSQTTAMDALEPEIELLSLEEIDEPEVAAAAA